MRILHITKWYPNKQNPKEALWVRSHIDSLSKNVTEQYILHLEVRTSNRFCLMYEENKNFQQIIFSVPTRKWFLIEILSSLILIKCIINLKINKNFDFVNFHIAYPNLVYWHYIKNFIRIPCAITEHWSAYHFNFGVSKKLPRIQKIFNQGITLLTVSKSLLEDIKRFANNDKIPGVILPNIVDTGVFNFVKKEKQESITYFMVSQWSWPKNPFIVIYTIADLLKEGKKITLRIGGYGLLYPQMQKKVKELRIEENVIFLGVLDDVQIAEEMNNASAFLHCSEYETFSVVCAEAISCGCPIIVSNVGGLKEFVTIKNGILVNNNNKEAWVESLKSFQSLDFERKSIALEANKKFSKKVIGSLYFKSLKKVYNKSK